MLAQFCDPRLLDRVFLSYPIVNVDLFYCSCPQCLEVSYQEKMTFTHMTHHRMRSPQRTLVTLCWSQELNSAECVAVLVQKLVHAVMQLLTAVRITRQLTGNTGIRKNVVKKASDLHFIILDGVIIS